MREFIENVINALELKLPVELRIKFKQYSNDAEYEPRFNKHGKLKRHVITVYFDSDNHRDFNTLVIHELIHAYQEENKINEIHGESFAKMAAKFPEYPQVYIPEIDD